MTTALHDAASRFLGAVFGPLGPVAGMEAFDIALDLACAEGTSVAAACEEVAMREHVPDYLRGLSRSELHVVAGDYVARHRFNARSGR